MKLDENNKRIPNGGVKALRDFLVDVLEENQQRFREVMFEAASEDPRLFMKYYAELSKLLVPKQQDVNVNLSLNEDFNALKALASKGGGQLGVEEPKYIEFEELGPGVIVSDD